MTIQPGANLYTQGFGSRPEGVEVPHIESRPPTASDNNYDIGKRWVDTAGGIEYCLTSFTYVNNIKSANWAFLGAAAGDLNTLTTADAVVVVPVAGNIDLVGSGSITTTGAGDTATVTLTGLTNHNVLVGAGTSTITKVAPSATAGVALVSTGAAADPAFGTVVVAGGGTGLTTLTAHSLYVGNGTSAPNAVANGTTGQVLTAVTGADPTFQNPAASSVSITGDSGGALNGDAFTFTGGTTGLTFSGAGTTETLTGTLGVANGGTGAVTLTGVLTGNGVGAVTANTVTDHGVVVGAASNAVGSTAVGATGTLLAGATGADPAFTASPSVTGSVTAGTTLTATLGAITATNGNLVLGTAGNKIVSTSVGTTTTAGANSFGSVTLTGGTATVATTAVTASSLIVTWRQSIGATGAAALGHITVGTITAATSFVINAVQAADATALQASDVSVIGWMIIN